MKSFVLFLGSFALLSACSSDIDKAELSVAKDAPKRVVTEVVGKTSAPIRIGYELLSEPTVGAPLEVAISAYSELPGPLMYSFSTQHSLTLGANQSAEMTVPASAASFSEATPTAVTVIPQAEGRSYLVVTVSVPTETGSASKLISVPIQVGDLPPRMESNGTLKGDGADAVISMPAKESDGN